MQIISISKFFFTAGLFQLMISCNSNNSKEKTADKKQTDTLVSAPPQNNIISEMKKCYSNEGLKYATEVTLLFSKKDGKDFVSGQVTSTELGSEKSEKGVIEGTINGNQLMIRFVGNPPTVGDASDWTDKPWTIKKTGEKETLLIVFNAKNYETNQWEDINYEFKMTDCK